MPDVFSLRDFLRQDLLRYQQLLGGTRSGPALWLGLLAPRFIPVLLCRLAYACAQRRLSVLGKLFSLMNCTFFGIEISSRSWIAPGLFLPHTHGTVIGAWRIGRNAIIYQGVTLGARGLDFTIDEVRRPTIGDNVVIGAGAKILGGVRVGDDARVGANAVVLADVPAGCAAVGVPAVLKESSGIGNAG